MEDGSIPERYELQETESRFYADRTRLNVEHSDATLIVSPMSPMGGTLLTIRHAREVGKPTLLVTRENEDTAPGLLQTFLREHNVGVLNVAGPRASGSPEVEIMVFHLLDRAIGS